MSETKLFQLKKMTFVKTGIHHFNEEETEKWMRTK